MTVHDEKHHTRSIYIDVEQSCWLGPPPPDIIENNAVARYLSQRHADAEDELRRLVIEVDAERRQEPLT